MNCYLKTKNKQSFAQVFSFFTVVLVINFFVFFTSFIYFFLILSVFFKKVQFYLPFPYFIFSSSKNFVLSSKKCVWNLNFFYHISKGFS